jgi:hypothetical protein
MKIFCCYTPAHEVMLERYFRPSLPAELELNAYRLEIDSSGDLFTPEYLVCIRRKIDLIIETVRAHPGEIFIWSDVDIIFLRPVAEQLTAEIETSGCAILFQREGPRTTDINGGFYVLRASAALERFFGAVRHKLAKDPQGNEQAIMNKLLPSVSDFTWGYLPLTYYARTHGWPPRADIAIYHANETPGAGGLRQKIRQFEEFAWIRRHGWPALLWSCATKIPKRLRRWTRELRGSFRARRTHRDQGIK